MAKYRNDNLIEYSDIEVFDMVHSGALTRFPMNFWDGYNSKDISRNLTRHLFEKILHWTIDDIKNSAISEVLYDNRLGNMVKRVFESSSSATIINAYPELEDWYIKKERLEKNEKNETGEIRIEYTDEELIQNLQDKAQEIGRKPFMREMKNPEGHVYSRRFGTWIKALIAAELIEDIFKGLNYSEENKVYFQQLLKEFVIENEKIPSLNETLELISEGEMKLYFNSYSGLCEYLESEYTKEELVNILKIKRNKLGRNPLYY
jgi:hypothetical protein